MKDININTLNKEQTLSLIEIIYDFINTRTAAGLLKPEESESAWNMYGKLVNHLKQLN